MKEWMITVMLEGGIVGRVKLIIDWGNTNAKEYGDNRQYEVDDFSLLKFGVKGHRSQMPIA